MFRMFRIYGRLSQKDLNSEHSEHLWPPKKFRMFRIQSPDVYRDTFLCVSGAREARSYRDTFLCISSVRKARSYRDTFWHVSSVRTARSYRDTFLCVSGVGKARSYRDTFFVCFRFQK